MQAQRDLNSLVKNDETRRVNRDRTTTIDKDETITVHGKRTEVVDLDETITIHQNRTEIVDLDETITIHQNRQERVDKNETIDIGGNRDETVHKSEQILIKGNRDKTVKGNDTLTVNKDRKETVNKSRSLTVDRTNTEFVKLGKSVTVGLGYATQVGTIMNTAVGIMQTEQIGRIKKSFVGKSYSITAGDEFKITVGKSSLVMNADGSIIITGTSIVTQAEGVNKVIGKDVLINPPGASAGGSQAEDSGSGASLDASKMSGVVGGGFGGGARAMAPTTNSLGGQLDPELKDGESYPENAGYEGYYGEPIEGGGGLAGFGNYNPQNPNEQWDPKEQKMMPKGSNSNNQKEELPWTAKILPNMFPRVSSHLVNDEEFAALLDKKADMRNVSYVGAGIAGYGPYIAAGGKEAVSILPQASINGASSGGALGGLSYIGTTPSEEWDPGKAFIYTTGGALTGGLGGLATTATGLAAAGAVGTYATQFTAEGEADLFAAGVNGLSGGVLKPYNLGVAGDVAQAATTSAASEFGKSVEFKESDPEDDLGLFWSKKP